MEIFLHHPLPSRWTLGWMEVCPAGADRDPNIPDVKDTQFIITTVKKTNTYIYRHANHVYYYLPRSLLSLIFYRDPRLVRQMLAFHLADNSNNLS